jgi:ribulose 1,5-bisphosphate carboxylase large subunit-like protein
MKPKIYITAISYHNFYYILQQSYSHIKTNKIIEELNEWKERIEVTMEVIKKSLKSDFKNSKTFFNITVPNLKVKLTQ